MATGHKPKRSKTRRGEDRPDSPARATASDWKRGEFPWEDFKAGGRVGSTTIPEFETYAARLGELLKDEGRFVLVKGSEIVGVYDSEEAADAVAARRFGGEPVMIKRITASDPIVSLGGVFQPLPDEPDFNEETRRAIRDVDAGEVAGDYEGAAAMFADWGV